MKRLLGIEAAQVPLEEAVASGNAEKLAQLVQEPPTCSAYRHFMAFGSMSWHVGR